MKDKTIDGGRRLFMKASAMGAVSLPLSYLLASVTAHAQDKVDPSDPAAQALAYTHDATSVDNKQYVEGSKCANCQLFQGKEGESWGPCPIFQNKLVAAEGWCTAWVKKAG